MAEQSTRSPEADGVLRRALRWWALTGTFLAGLLVGAVVVGFLASGTSMPQGGGDATPTTGPVASGVPPGEAGAGVTGEVLVNAACLRAINAAQDSVDVVEDLGEALTELNATRLDEIVRRLQPLQRRLDEDVAACRVVARAPEPAPGTVEGPGSSAGTGPPSSPSAPTD